MPVSAQGGRWGAGEGGGRVWGRGCGGATGGCHPFSLPAPVLAPPGRRRPAESRQLPRSLRARQRGREVSPARGPGGGRGGCPNPAPPGGPSVRLPPSGAWKLSCWGAGGPACWLMLPSCPPLPTSSLPTSSCGRSACLVSGDGGGREGTPPPHGGAPSPPLTPPILCRCETGAAADEKWLSALEGTRWLDHVR